ncbi:hypothetical protein Bca4012_086219 [Brassica carinata]
MEVIGFSETEMEAAEQLVQLSEDDTLSCSSGTGLSVSGCEGGGGNTKRHDDVVSDEVQNDGVVCMMNNNATDAQRFVKAITETNIISRDVKWAGWAGLGVSEWASFFAGHFGRLK